MAITLRVNLQALPPESIKPAKRPGCGISVKILNPYFSFLVYGTSTYKIYKFFNEVDNVCIHCFNGTTYLYVPNYFTAITRIQKSPSCTLWFPLSLTLTHGPVGIASILGVSFQHHLTWRFEIRCLTARFV